MVSSAQQHHYKVAQHGKHFFIGFILGFDLEEGVPVPVHWLKLQQIQLAEWKPDSLDHPSKSHLCEPNQVYSLVWDKTRYARSQYCEMRHFFSVFQTLCKWSSDKLGWSFRVWFDSNFHTRWIFRYSGRKFVSASCVYEARLQHQQLHPSKGEMQLTPSSWWRKGRRGAEATQIQVLHYFPPLKVLFFNGYFYVGVKIEAIFGP